MLHAFNELKKKRSLHLMIAPSFDAENKNLLSLDITTEVIDNL